MNSDSVLRAAPELFVVKGFTSYNKNSNQQEPESSLELPQSAHQ